MPRLKKTHPYRKRAAIPASRNRSHLYHRTAGQSQKSLPSIPLRPLLMVAGLVLIIWLLFVSPIFQVTSVTVSGLRIVPRNEVLQRASEVMGSGSLLLLPRDSEWLFPSGEVASKLKEDFPSFSKVRVSHHFPHGINIVVQEQPVSLVWQTSGQSYLVGQNGVVTGLVPPRYKSQLVVTDTANLPVKVGKQILSPAFINFMQAVVTELPPTVHTKVAKVTVAETTLEATVVTAQGYSILFDTTRSPQKQLGYLKEIVDQVSAQHQTLDYIDLRVDDRIFYKLK